MSDVYINDTIGSYAKRAMLRLAPGLPWTTSKQWYDAYMHSIWWGVRRRRYLAQHPNCERCKLRPATEIHHKSYERMGEELDTDLRALCEGCHCITHGIALTTAQVNQRRREAEEVAWDFRTQWLQAIKDVRGLE